MGVASMKALPKRKGNGERSGVVFGDVGASMKALPKRKGNSIKRRWGAVQLLLPQ